MSKTSVDVVLTAYKKLDALKLQLEAIKNQTYEVENIYLFKDGIGSYYNVILNEDMISQFDGVYISPVNVGVWGRFEYAKSVCKSECVCVFDDDTVPGNKWIENCVLNFENTPGVYGTNGIIAVEPEMYPYKMMNVGWHRPNFETKKVDFVGHAWFFKTEWLKWMIQLKDKYDYKLVGEDMALSFACQQHGISTFVPAHPYADLNMWGSKPSLGMQYGSQSSAVSVNSTNLLAMNKAIKTMKEDGWKFVVEDKSEDLYKGIEKSETKEKLIVSDIAEFISNNNMVFLYGAGKYGSAMYKFLKKHNIDIDGFVVSNCTNTIVEIDGDIIQIISIHDIEQYENVGILLALSEVHHGYARDLINDGADVFLSKENTYSYSDLYNLCM